MLNDIRKGSRDGFTGSKILNKASPIFLEENLKEATFDWRLKRLKAEKTERLTIFEDKL